MSALRVPIYQISAFSNTSFNGNPASVCLLEDWLPDPLLQAIATENNHPETAFLIERDGAYDLRWFTPACEVTLCGHATLAAAHVVDEFIRPRGENRAVTFSSPSGLLHVSKQGCRWRLDFPELAYEPIVAPERIAEAVGVVPHECYASLDLMITLRSQAELEAVSPDYELIKRLPGRGLVITAPGDDSDFVSRFFAPKLLISEDTITGSAHCTLVPFWAKRLGRDELAAAQLSTRQSTTHVIRLACAYRRPRVHLFGEATTYLEGFITIPDHI